jgi:hypothetical protein
VTLKFEQLLAVLQAFRQEKLLRESEKFDTVGERSRGKS